MKEEKQGGGTRGSSLVIAMWVCSFSKWSQLIAIAWAAVLSYLNYKVRFPDPTRFLLAIRCMFNPGFTSGKAQTLGLGPGSVVCECRVAWQFAQCKEPTQNLPEGNLLDFNAFFKVSMIAYKILPEIPSLFVLWCRLLAQLGPIWQMRQPGMALWLCMACASLWPSFRQLGWGCKYGGSPCGKKAAQGGGQGHQPRHRREPLGRQPF